MVYLHHASPQTGLPAHDFGRRGSTKAMLSDGHNPGEKDGLVGVEVKEKVSLPTFILPHFSTSPSKAKAPVGSS